MKPLPKAILINSLVYIGYLGFSSLMLFNHKGGADIVFLTFLFFSLIIHLITVLAIDIKYRKWEDIAVTGFWFLFTMLFLETYMDFMWEVTSRFQG